MPTVQETTITNRRLVLDDLRIWRKVADLTPSEEEAIIPGWLPSSPDWEDVTDQVRLGQGVRATVGNNGPTIGLTVNQHSQDAWPYRRPVALVGRHWDGTDWYEYVAAWGRVVGAGGQRRRGAEQSGEVQLDLARWWMGAQIPAHRLGRLNAALGASLVGGSTVLATPLSESPGEYVNQASCAATLMVDGNMDTVTVADAFADPAIPSIGDTAKPRVLRLYAGRTSRSIGAGGEPLFVEIWAGHNIAPWGYTWTGIPEMYNAGAGEGQAAVRDDARLTTTVQTIEAGEKAFQVHVKQNTNPKGDTWVQWIVADAAYANRPMTVKLELRAAPASPAAVGRRLDISLGTAQTVGAQTKNVRPFVLSADWQEVKFDFDSSTDYAGAKISVKTWPGESQDGAWTYQIRRLDVGMGWDHDEYAKGHDFVALRLGIDDGIGHEKWVRCSWDLADGVGNFRIPAYDSIIITDDIDTLKRKFDVGNRTVWQMKKIAPWWFFGPSIGRIKLALMTNPADENDIDATVGGGGTFDLLDDINLSAVPAWTPMQALSRQTPIGTGSLAAEDFPQIGVIPAFGSAYWYFDLGAPDHPTLLRDLPIGSTRVPVSDLDRYARAGSIKIGSETRGFDGKEEDALILTAATTATHSQGDAVIPCYDANVGAGTDVQTGKLIDYCEIRRKDGKATIADGFVLYSNATSPGDPGSGGSKWENHPDWDLLTRFSGNLQTTVAAAPKMATVSGGASAPALQARFWCVGISRMNRTYHKRERSKINELVLREFVPGAGASGEYLGHGAGDINGAIGHLLVRHAGVPLGKFVNAAPSIPLNDLHIAPTTASGAVGSLLSRGLLALVVDNYGYVTLEPSPSSPLFDRQEAEWTWTEANSWGAEQTGTWDEPSRVSQVVAWGYDPVTMRNYRVSYPPTPNPLGASLEVKDLIVSSPDQLREIARARFRDANTRRGLKIKAGAVPWLRVNQRHVVNYPSLDPGGEWSGINFFVESYEVSIALTERRGIVWTTTISLREMAL